jgi:hypothetical protein
MKKTTNGKLNLAYDNFKNEACFAIEENAQGESCAICIISDENETKLFIRGKSQSVEEALSAVMKESKDFHSLVKNAL